MRDIRVGVVEDDPTACQRVLDYMNQYHSETGTEFTISVFDDGEKIVEKYTPTYDILLLDIEMKHMDGMAAARQIRERDDSVVIVFITAAPQYAINGYEVQALSYLLKPVPYFAFRQEIKRSIDMVRRRADDAMLIDTGGKQMRVELSDVLYLESIRHTIIIHTLGGKLSVTGTLKDFEERLAGQSFFRSNSCYLVNMQHVVGVDGQDCVMSNGEALRISRPRKKAFLVALANYLGSGGATSNAVSGATAASNNTGTTGNANTAATTDTAATVTASDTAGFAAASTTSAPGTTAAAGV
ncbi:Two-component response regulator virR [Bifidobacterium reuteri DSM 23975]|uniref:Two-component response regulator virR n=1 Tax=Bifidobacterium reuteri DSM 23975 TaxID=1437610 RepID=A0A087CK23_9BIFI|nr:LytTR family DNA-binding domain-containing protein [Bifidobacterium reuteri]KFI83623.1 Two-component response regulator virR [Bifidobacterium reuteri DSM 23975]